MKAPSFSINHHDEELRKLVDETNQKTLAIWAIDCAQRVLPYFAAKFPDDPRPSRALETLQEWIRTGVFSMHVIRKASLDSHAAAREVGEDNSARSAARACGQAVATAHVPRHAYGSAIYAQQAIFRVSNSIESANTERDWQYQRLLNLRQGSNDF